MIIDSKPPASEEDEVVRSAAPGSRDPRPTIETSASVGTSISDVKISFIMLPLFCFFKTFFFLQEDVTRIDPESSKGLDLLSIQPEIVEPVGSPMVYIMFNMLITIILSLKSVSFSGRCSGKDLRP